MTATVDSTSVNRDDLVRVAVATVLGVLGIYVAVVAADALLHGSVSRPGDAVLVPLLGLHALVVGIWCGLRDMSENSTVVVSTSYVVALVALMPVAEFVEPVGALTDPNLPLLAVLFVMVLGVVQGLSYVGYRVGGALAD
ncbi:hypothetical protein [Halorubellus litoreus]|uniref:Integral membrane protein n=1 Tax=Halorubellus litoreus TaxID=755308 RepID=A0ABD5VAN1_9EURY